MAATPMSDAEWKAFCERMAKTWDESLDVEMLMAITEIINGMRTRQGLALLGILAVNIINHAADDENEACEVSRAFGLYIHDRCHDSFEKVKVSAAMAERKINKVREQ